MIFLQFYARHLKRFPEGGAKHIMKITPTRAAKLGVLRNAADV